MKTCPFCAEEIQDAAIVCKHCGRDLQPLRPAVAMAPAGPPKGSGLYRWLVIVIVVGAALLFANQYFRAEFLAFDAKREDWHRRCDSYVGRAPRDVADGAKMRACKDELTELTDYAVAKGWK